MAAVTLEALITETVDLPAAALDDTIRDLELQRRELDARLAAVTAVAEQRQQFAADGHRSMSGYLKAHLNCSGVEANRLRRLGKLVNEHPTVGDALFDGIISTDQADLMARANHDRRGAERFAEFVPRLLEYAEHFAVREFSIIIDRYLSNANADGTAPDDNDADATMAAGPDGVHATISGGTALQGAEMKAIFDRAVEAEFDRDVAARRAEHGDLAHLHPLPRTAAQRRFAAQYAIHLSYVTAPADGVAPAPIVDIVFSAGAAAQTLVDHGLAGDPDIFTPPMPDPVPMLLPVSASSWRTRTTGSTCVAKRPPASRSHGTKRCGR